MTHKPTDTSWQAVCRSDDLILHAGIAVRAHGTQVAIFQTDEGLYALDNVDPLCGAAVLARGIVGDAGGEPVVASPMYKHHFSLVSGRCLEDDSVRVQCWPVRRESDGTVCIGRPAMTEPTEHAHGNV